MEGNTLLLHHRWHVIYTRSRHDKVVQQELLKKGIEFLAPTIRLCRQWSDRKKWIDVPMFPSYIFVHPQLRQMEEVLMTPGAVKYIMFNGRKAVVQDHEIEFLRLAQREETQIEVVPQTFCKEQQVVIASGTFQGLKGRLLRSYTDGRIAVSIEEIGYSIILKSDVRHTIVSPAYQSEDVLV